VKLPPFSVHRPDSVREASRLMLELGDEAALYCGGTELLLAMKLGLADYAYLVDTKRIPGLHVLGEHDGVLRIGAAVTHYELETSELVRSWCPAMPAMLSQVANIRVRSAGTLGGNLCFADPHSDPATFLMAAGATLQCQLDEQTRTVAVTDFFTGSYETALRDGEVLTAIDIPAQPAGTGLGHVRMKLHERPVVTVAARIGLAGGSVTQAVLVVGSVGVRPVAVGAAGELIGAGRAEFASRAEECSRQAAGECVPADDGECSEEYLRQLVLVHGRQALAAAHRAADGAGPAAAG
jgi:aerobic carbon-monoxide dehydrogenase medium subunit